jgi:hypothetical protein
MTSFRRGAPVMLIVLVCGCLIAACGSSSSTTSPTAAASASSGSSGSSRFTALRACLKQHGVTLPARRPGSGRPYGGGAPPNGGPPGGGFFGGGGGGGGGAGGRGFADNPKLAAALKACGGGNFRSGQRFRLSQTKVNAYVACVRQHGYNLPKPNFSGKGPVFPSNIRSNPKFQAASKACQSLLVPPRPGGAGTSTTARS